jgi:ABC-type tungstate transport system permease subunit
LVGKVGLLHRLVLVASVVILLVVAYYLLFPLNQYVVRLKVSTTTSLYATGLLEAIAEAFRKEYPNVRLEFIAVGSGVALRIAERGDACVVLIHEPYLEHQYLMKGVIGGGRVFAYNYFVVVGPKNDPANISGVDNVLEVFRRIYVAGESGRTYFVSRGDNSGTHLRELMIWGLLGLNPGNTSWYRSCGCGMSDALLIANELGAYGVVKREDVEKLITHVSSKAKLTDYEKEFIHNVLDIMYGMAASEYLPTPSTLATLSEYITLDPKLVGKVFEERRVPEEWRNIWLTYISVRPVKADAKSLLSTYVRALRQGVVSKEDVDKYVKELPQYGFTPREIEFIMRSVDLEEQIIEARENKREYIPTPSMIASMLEYVSIPAAQIQKVFEARKIPEEWRSIWMQYYLVRPIADDARILANAYYRAKRLQIPLGDVEKQILEILKASGMTPQELSIRDLATQIEVVIDEYLENRREYIPTPSMLASMSEYITIPEQVIQQVFTARRIPSEWQQIWRQYISVRPLVDDIRGLLTSYRRAMLYAAIPEEVKKRVEEYAKTINFTQAEWDVLTLRIMLEELILESREYIPTPLTLASICEYIPEARRFFEDVVKARRIPERWRELWARYVDIKPLVDDVKRYVSRAEALYVRFMTKKDDFEKILQEASQYLGYTSKEIEFLMKVTEFERYRNAWTELIGSVERLVELSEYSPKAANYALGKLKAMIDALPLTTEEKNELKAMWEEYIKNRPVKSEAKTYLTQLINAYVEGLITDITFKKELYEMKNWGFSDNELMFYEAQAALRKARKWKIPIGE